MAAWEICLRDCGVSGSLAYKMAASLGVLPTRWRRGNFAYKMAAFLSFTKNRAAWEICRQDGGVSKSLTYKMAAMPRSECYPQDGGVKNLPTRWPRFWESYLQNGGVVVLPTRWRRF